VACDNIGLHPYNDRRKAVSGHCEAGTQRRPTSNGKLTISAESSVTGCLFVTFHLVHSLNDFIKLSSYLVRSNRLPNSHNHQFINYINAGFLSSRLL